MLHRRSAGFLLLGLVALVWCRALLGGYVWDDLDNLLYGDRLRHWSSLFEVFLHDAMWSANKAQATVGTYRPLALATFVVDLNLLGDSPTGLHLTSLLYHLGATAVLYGLLSRWVDWRAAFAVTLVWAVHPNHAEAVAWVNGRSEVLALLCGGGAALAVSRPQIGAGHVVLAGLGLLFALFGKEAGLVFVPVVLFLASEASGATRRRAVFMRVHWPTVGAAAVAVAVYLGLRAHALDGGAAAGVALNFKTQAITDAPAMLGKCTQAMLWPYEISVNHLRRWLITAHPAWWYGGAAVAIAQLLAALWLWRRGQRAAAFGFLWWLGSLIPVLLIGVLGWPGLHRWFYMGSPGLAWGLYGVFAELTRGRGPRGLGAGVAAVVVLALTAQTQRAIPVWWSGDRLFGAMVDEHPDVAFGYIGLGAWLLEHHRYDEAERILRRSTELDVVRNDGFYFLSRTLAAKGDCEGSVQVVEARTATLDPSVAWAAGKCYAEKRGDHVNAHRYFKQCETNYTDCSDGVAKAIAVGAVPDPNAPATAAAPPSEAAPATQAEQPASQVGTGAP